MAAPLGRRAVETTVTLGDEPRIGEMDVGGKRDWAFLMSQAYTMPVEVRTISVFLQLVIEEHGTPRQRVGMSLITTKKLLISARRFIWASEKSYLRPVGEYM